MYCTVVLESMVCNGWIHIFDGWYRAADEMTRYTN